MTEIHEFWNEKVTDFVRSNDIKSIGEVIMVYWYKRTRENTSLFSINYINRK